MLSFKYIKWPVLLMIVIFVGHQSWSQAKKEITSEPRDLLPIANILENSAASTDILLARKPHLAYFAGIKNKTIPQVKSIYKLIEFAKANQARFIFYGPIEQQLRPDLHVLTQPVSVSTRLKLIYKKLARDNFLYEVK